MPKHLVIHAKPTAKRHIESGKHRFVNLIRSTFETRGYTVTTGDTSDKSRFLSRFDRRLHMFDIDGASGPNSLNFRCVYFQPFWSIEKAGARHQPRLANKAFHAIDIGGGLAKTFFKIMQNQHLPADLPSPGVSDYVFVPLQGHLLKRRKWQYADAATMVNAIRRNDPDRRIVLKLHPKITYGPAELALIDTLQNDPKIGLSTAPAHQLLAHCAYVVTQNSAVAFEGILHRKPAILFASTDFHHLFETVKHPADAAKAFARVLEAERPYEKYLFWVLRLNCANAARDNAEADIVEMVNEAGWNLPQ